MAKITAEKLFTQLKAGTVSPVYLLTGEDVYRKNQVINELIKILQPDDFNIYRSEADKADWSEALTLANTAPVFPIPAW